MLTLPQVAAMLGISRSRAWQLVRDGRLTAIKAGRDWLVREADLEGFRPNPPGRPKKAKPDTPAPS